MRKSDWYNRIMSKKKIVLICGLVVIVIGGIAFVTFNLTRSEEILSPAVSFQLTPTPVEEKLASWKDQAEFSFLYPESLTLDPHDEDKDYYAHVELKSATHAGNLIVWVKDTDASNIADWQKREKIQNPIDSLLDGVEAKKVLLSGESRKIVTSSVYGGYLYEIEVNPTDFDYWNRIYNQVIASFKFIPAETVQESAPAAGYTDEASEDVSQGGGDSYEEEFIE